MPRPLGALACSGRERPHPCRVRGAGSNLTCRAPPREAHPSCWETAGRARPPPHASHAHTGNLSLPTRTRALGPLPGLGGRGPGRNALLGAQTVPVGQQPSHSSEPRTPRGRTAPAPAFPPQPLRPLAERRAGVSVSLGGRPASQVPPARSTSEAQCLRSLHGQRPAPPGFKPARPSPQSPRPRLGAVARWGRREARWGWQVLGTPRAAGPMPHARPLAGGCVHPRRGVAPEVGGGRLRRIRVFSLRPLPLSTPPPESPRRNAGDRWEQRGRCVPLRSPRCLNGVRRGHDDPPTGWFVFQNAICLTADLGVAHPQGPAHFLECGSHGSCLILGRLSQGILRGSPCSNAPLWT